MKIIVVFCNKILPMAYSPKSLTLKGIPEDIYRELLRVQGEEKAKRNTQFNLEQTIYKIIKSTVKKDAVKG